MPLFYLEEKEDFQFAIWKMDEDVEELLELASLSAQDMRKVNSFTHQARKKEWICVRLLLKKLGYDILINYYETGKPFLENSGYHISISHTRDFAGLIISKKNTVGIDLERIHPRIEKIAHKFVSEEEEKFIPGRNRLEKLFVIWGAKEVLFKMHSIGELIFKENLLVHSFEFCNPGIATATVLKEDFQKTYTLGYELKDDLLVTWCVDE